MYSMHPCGCSAACMWRREGKGEVKGPARTGFFSEQHENYHKVLSKGVPWSDMFQNVILVAMWMEVLVKVKSRETS